MEMSFHLAQPPRCLRDTPGPNPASLKVSIKVSKFLDLEVNQSMT